MPDTQQSGPTEDARLLGLIGGANPAIIVIFFNLSFASAEEDEVNWDNVKVGLTD